MTQLGWFSWAMIDSIGRIQEGNDWPDWDDLAWQWLTRLGGFSWAMIDPNCAIIIPSRFGQDSTHALRNNAVMRTKLCESNTISIAMKISTINCRQYQLIILWNEVPFVWWSIVTRTDEMNYLNVIIRSFTIMQEEKGVLDPDLKNKCWSPLHQFMVRLTSEHLNIWRSKHLKI